MIPNDVQDALGRLLGVFHECGMDYALMGGYAVATWGVPRATFDIDVLVSAKEGLDRFFAACERHGFDVPDEYRGGWRDRVGGMPLARLQIFLGTRAIPVDLFLVESSLQRAALTRRCPVSVSGLEREVPVITPEDLVLFKLLADRPRDRIDAVNVLSVQRIRATPYLRDWARRLNKEAQLDDWLAEAELNGEEPS